MKTYRLAALSGAVLAIAPEAAGRALREKDADAALLLLCLTARGGMGDEAALLRETGLDEKRLRRAAAVLGLRPSETESIPDSAETVSAGTVSVSESIPDSAGTEATTVSAPESIPAAPAQAPSSATPSSATPPSATPPSAWRPPAYEPAVYTPQELSQGLRENERFRWLYHETESRFGRTLKSYEAGTLYSLVDDLKLPAEVVALLVNQLAIEARERGAPLSMRTVARAAARWYEDGIATPEAADERIAEHNRRRTAQGRLQTAFGLTGRRLSPTEQRYMSYLVDLGLPEALYLEAYDVTVTNKGSLIWPYLRTILENWKKKGYTTVEETRRRAPRQQTGVAVSEEYVARVRRFTLDGESDAAEGYEEYGRNEEYERDESEHE